MLAASEAEFPWFCSAFEVEGAKPRELAGNQPLSGWPVPVRDVGSPRQTERYHSPARRGPPPPPRFHSRITVHPAAQQHQAG